VEYAVKLTKTPHKVGEEDVEELRRAGLTDQEILNTALAASYFNFVNRMVLGLGVELTEEELRGYKY
jgi:alkylhydroperoxidase family enzyme